MSMPESADPGYIRRYITGSLGVRARAMSWPERTHTLPDGRQLSAVYEGEPAGWVVHLVGRDDQAVAARDIHDALVDLLEPGEGQSPSWFTEAAADPSRVRYGTGPPLPPAHVAAT
jgi:hypothetical protein